ncbi:MAG: leucine--tRNA ligase, partial [Candidatus Saccharibacteria bacterium]|nr:leucine--tRNA ligase [Candidatus Saccharibacteria bacterium]
VCGGDAERETDTLDTYIDSSWYFLRYLDPANTTAIFDSGVANKWMPVDFYNGGDHATAHMIYARFITRFLHKLGLVDNPEPFKRFLFNGKVTAADGTMFSKSKGNGVDPLEIINSGYGADALRTYLMFAAPLDLWIKWDAKGVPATYRFLNRIWNLVQEFNNAVDGDRSDAVLKLVHPAIKKVTGDIEDQKYNTAIATMMKLTNELYELKAKDHFSDKGTWRFALESLVALVAPFAPHISEELWHQLGHQTSVHRDSWPQWDDTYLVTDTITIIIQVNGKLRGKLEVGHDTTREDIESQALANENVQAFVTGKEPKKVIYVPGKLVNIVI